MEKHVPNLIAALWIFGFFGVLLLVSSWVRPSSRPQASTTEDSGDPTPWIRVSARYQVILAISAAFFVGALILFPAMAVFRQSLTEGRGLLALAAVGLFLATLSIALAYAWMKGDLSWMQDKENPSRRHGHS